MHEAADAAAAAAIVLVTLDRESRSMRLSRSDGKEAHLPLPSAALAGMSALSQLHWVPDGPELHAVTRAGDVIGFELPRHGGPDGPDGRLVVYLDQNQWSLLAPRHPADASNADVAAFERLAEWVRQRRIVLPASAGHYLETTKWRNPARRYRLGLIILQLSRGWQMRNPLQVRRDEIHDAFRHAFGNGVGTHNLPVFTLGPKVLYGPSRAGVPRAAPDDFSPEAAHALEALSCASALIAVMLDAQHVEPGPAHGWAEANQRFSDWLGGEKRDAQQKRRSIEVLLLSDLGAEITEEARAAGVTPNQMSQWMQQSFRSDINALPATGLFRELLHEKHLNKGSRWKPSDLIDMAYLSCAAGYADVVVCEHWTADALSRGQRRLARRQNVFRTLREAVPVVEAALAASPR